MSNYTKAKQVITSVKCVKHIKIISRKGPLLTNLCSGSPEMTNLRADEIIFFRNLTKIGTDENKAIYSTRKLSYIYINTLYIVYNHILVSSVVLWRCYYIWFKCYWINFVDFYCFYLFVCPQNQHHWDIWFSAYPSVYSETILTLGIIYWHDRKYMRLWNTMPRWQPSSKKLFLAQR